MARYVLKESTPELRGKILGHVIEKGRANNKQAAIVLGIHPNTMVQKVERGEIKTFALGARRFVSLEELLRVGVTLPSVFRQQLQDHIRRAHFDSNLTSGDYYD